MVLEWELGPAPGPAPVPAPVPGKELSGLVSKSQLCGHKLTLWWWTVLFSFDRRYSILLYTPGLTTALS